MARQFNGTDQFLVSASTINLTAHNKITVAWWGWIDNYTADNQVTVRLGPDNATVGTFQFRTINTASQVRGSHFGDGGLTNAQWDRATAAAWHHYVWTMDKSLGTNEQVALYIDDTLKTVNSRPSNGNNSDNFGNLLLYCMKDGTGATHTPGRIAEVAIWGGINFSQTDVDALWNTGAGVDAGTVQAGSLVNYWQICGSADPEPADVGGIALTVTGATSVAHPISGSGICEAAPGGATVPAMPIQSNYRW